MSVQAAITMIEALVAQKTAALTPFSATVDSLSGGKVKIKRLGSATADSQLYSRLAGMKLTAGDEVACINLLGSPLVLGKTQRATANEVAIVTGNDGDILQLLSGVWGAAFPPTVLVNWFSAVASTTPSTTSTATFQTAGSGAWVLPTGTWTVLSIGFHRAKRTSAGLINTRVTVDGTAGTVMDSTQDASVFGGAWALCGKTGVASGSRTIAIEFKNNSSATATSENPMIFSIAIRTA